MKRLIKHKTSLFRLIRDERLTPHRRLLAECLLLWLDEENKETKEKIFSLIESQFGTPKHTKWIDKNDTSVKSSLYKIEAEAVETLKDYFSQVQAAQEEANQEKEEGNEVSEPNVFSTSI